MVALGEHDGDVRAREERQRLDVDEAGTANREVEDAGSTAVAAPGG